MKFIIVCLLLAFVLALASVHGQSQPPFVVPAGATAISGSGSAPSGPVSAVLAPVNQGLAYFCAFVVSTAGWATLDTILVSGLGGSSAMSLVFAPAQGVLTRRLR